MATAILLDCDPGHDDAIALLLALASPELHVLGVTTVHGNQTLEKTTANALRVLELAGRLDIPVAGGAAQPLVRELQVPHTSTESGLDGPELPPRASSPSPSTLSISSWSTSPRRPCSYRWAVDERRARARPGIRPARIVLMGVRSRRGT
jgi:inosine-uridine nucleoside N-ribohydrolase